MSLIGSLEDLGLGDILQIISLSQKSGVLSIRGENGEGSIYLQQGLVRGAVLKGGPEDLRGVLVGGGFLEADEFDLASERARREGTTVEQAIAAQTSLSMEKIDELRCECVEAAVIAMFAWPTGEFSFDVRVEAQPDEPPLFLPVGINAQYLAMEGSRIEDESAFGGDAETGEEAPSAAEAMGLAVAESFDAEEVGDEGEIVEISEVAEPLEQEAVGTSPVQTPVPSLPNAPLVVIDPDLVALEWIKKTLEDAFPRIHIFQRWDLGLGPIRQYLARANRPVVLLSPAAVGDPLSGIRSGRDFVERLKAQQSRLPIVWLQEVDGEPVEDLAGADAALTRPSAQQLRSSRSFGELDEVAASLRDELATVLASSAATTEPAAAKPAVTNVAPQSPDELLRLQEITELLSVASTRGEALPVAICFASEVFERIAMFMVREQTVVGMAQYGLTAAGGPDDEALRRVELSRVGCAWFRNMLEAGRPVRSGPSDAGDYTLAALLGNSAAPEAYIAPIESGGEVVAILYADNLPSGRPLGDSKALEVVLHHVGLALERTVLERALAEAQGGSPS